MCWEKRIQFSCGCEEVQQVRFCEWAAMPWLTNVAHPKGLPMQPTIDILPVKRVCRYCGPEKGKGKAGMGGEGGEGEEGDEDGGEGDEDEDEDMGEDDEDDDDDEDEDEDVDMDAEGESVSEDELRAMIGEGYSLDGYRVVSGFGGSLGARVGGSAGSAGGVRSSLVPVPEEDEEDEDDEEGGAGIS